MIRTTNLVMKDMADLVPGELIRHSFGGAAGLMVFMGTQENGEYLLGVLKSDAFETPMVWYSSSAKGKTLSYGAEWVIEEIHGPETACGNLYAQSQAHLFIDGESLVWRFSAGRGRFGFQSLYFILASGSYSEIGKDAAPIAKWRVWESVEKHADGGEPLLEFGVSE